MKKLIYINTRWEDFHFWDNAPDEVSYLRNIHRHEFHLKVTVDVNHSDRDIEFIMMKNRIISDVIPLIKLMRSNKSCEMMSEFVIQKIIEKYNPSFIEVDISEDGENGAIVTYSL